MTPEVYRAMLIDPHGNPNNHGALLIDSAVYKASARLYALENATISQIHRTRGGLREVMRMHGIQGETE